MVRVIVLYKHPVDAEAFEEYYERMHLKLAEKLPLVVKRELSRCIPGLDGSLPFYRVSELWFNTREDVEAAFASPEGRAAIADVQNYATGGTQFLMSEVVYESTPHASLR